MLRWKDGVKRDVRKAGVVVMPKMCVAKCAMLKDRDYDVTPYIIAQEVRQMRGWSAKSARYLIK